MSGRSNGTKKKKRIRVTARRHTKMVFPSKVYTVPKSARQHTRTHTHTKQTIRSRWMLKVSFSFAPSRVFKGVEKVKTHS